MTKTKIVRLTLLLIYCTITDGGEDGLEYWVRDPKFERRSFDPANISLPATLNDSLSKVNKLLRKRHKHRNHHLRSGNDFESNFAINGNRDGIFQNLDGSTTSETISHALLWVTTPGLPSFNTKEIIYKTFHNAVEPRALINGYNQHKYNQIYDIPGYNNPRYTRRLPKNRDSRISHYVSKEHLFGASWTQNNSLSNRKHKDNSLYSGSQSRETTNSTKKKSKHLRYKHTDESGIFEEQKRLGNTKKFKKGKHDKNLLRHEKFGNKQSGRQKTSYKPIKSYKLSENNYETQKRHEALVNDVSDTLDPYNIHKHFSQEKLDCEFPEASFDIQVIGKTISRNDILLLKIKEKESDLARHFRVEDKYAEETPEKKIIFIVHGLSSMGIHKVPSLSRVKDFYKLLKCYTRHLEEFDFYVIPNANPDGFQASAPSASARYGKEWNKNQSPQEICLGVALDRNFDIGWNDSKQVSACNQHYPGPYPFSEPESEAVRQIIHKYSSKLLAYIHVHASTYDPSEYKGDAILYPKGYTDVVSEDDRYIDLRGEIEEEMLNAGFRILSFTVDTLHHWYKKVSGTSVDYASSIYGIPYTMEFVMQSYENHTADAFKEIWDRVIDVAMNHMHNRLTKSTMGV